MAWPKLRNRRSPASQSSDHTGAVPETASQDAAREPADVPFWSWGKQAESADLDDPADTLPPDRPEYPDGPDPEYRDATATAGADQRFRPWQEPVVTPVENVGEEREGIGQHLGNLAHLSGDPRMRAWQRRAIIAIIVGVAFGILLNWRYGLTFALLATVADTIYRSRTVFNGPEGVRLTAVQRRTVRQLASMERKGYRAMHCVSLPHSDDEIDHQIDHLVIGPPGVFAIDSETWDRRIPVRTSSHRQLWHGSTNMKERLEHARWEAGRAAELLSDALGSPVSVRPAMAVYGPRIPWDVATIRDVDVFSGPRLRKYLKGRARQDKRQRLSASEIERIDKAAHVAFPRQEASSRAS